MEEKSLTATTRQKNYTSRNTVALGLLILSIALIALVYFLSFNGRNGKPIYKAILQDTSSTASDTAGHQIKGADTILLTTTKIASHGAGAAKPEVGKKK